VGEGIDSLIFMMVAFAGTIPTQSWLESAATIWLLKTLYEMLATPLTYIVVNGVIKIEILKVQHANLPAE
jgi:queuosine precursor transporter